MFRNDDQNQKATSLALSAVADLAIGAGCCSVYLNVCESGGPEGMERQAASTRHERLT